MSESMARDRSSLATWEKSLSGGHDEVPFLASSGDI